jgi:hypothetical protein
MAVADGPGRRKNGRWRRNSCFTPPPGTGKSYFRLSCSRPWPSFLASCAMAAERAAFPRSPARPTPELIDVHALDVAAAALWPEWPIASAEAASASCAVPPVPPYPAGAVREAAAPRAESSSGRTAQPRLRPAVPALSPRLLPQRRPSRSAFAPQSAAPSPSTLRYPRFACESHEIPPSLRSSRSASSSQPARPPSRPARSTHGLSPTVRRPTSSPPPRYSPSRRPSPTVSSLYRRPTPPTPRHPAASPRPVGPWREAAPRAGPKGPLSVGARAPPSRQTDRTRGGGCPSTFNRPPGYPGGFAGYFEDAAGYSGRPGDYGDCFGYTIDASKRFSEGSGHIPIAYFGDRTRAHSGNRTNGYSRNNASGCSGGSSGSDSPARLAPRPLAVHLNSPRVYLDPPTAANANSGGRLAGGPELDSGYRPARAPALDSGDRPFIALQLDTGGGPADAPKLGSGDRPTGTPEAGHGGGLVGAPELGGALRVASVLPGGALPASIHLPGPSQRLQPATPVAMYGTRRSADEAHGLSVDETNDFSVDQALAHCMDETRSADGSFSVGVHPPSHRSHSRFTFALILTLAPCSSPPQSR